MFSDILFLNLDGFRKCYGRTERALLLQNHDIMEEFFLKQNSALSFPLQPQNSALSYAPTIPLPGIYKIMINSNRHRTSSFLELPSFFTVYKLRELHMASLTCKSNS